MADEAYCVFREFPEAPRQRFQVPMHYFLYCSSGALRLEAHGRVWSLPPARAAIIRAEEPVFVSIPRPVTACSVLLARGFVNDPPAALTVVDMSPLARELILASAPYHPQSVLDAFGRQLFRMLALEVYRLTHNPSRASMPAPRTPALARAIALTEQQLESAPAFEDIASAVALTPRTLTRRFAEEMGMPFRVVLRRLRMFRATEMLVAADDSVTAIALSTGYHSLSAFNAAFREFTGETPTQYRRRVRRAHLT